MESLSIYLFKSIVVSGVFTVWYLLGLRGYRLHQYNRFFLLSSLVLSLLIPLLHFEFIDFTPIVAERLAPVSLLIQGGAANEPSAANGVTPQITSINWQAIIGVVALSLSLILLAMLSIRIVIIRRLCRKFPVTQMGAINVVQTNLPKAPFAFFNYLFWNKSIELEGEIGQLIFRHEATHITQKHTYDKLFCQLLTCVCWFNPFFWIIQKELNLVHEFIADEQAVEDRDTHLFAMMVLKTYNNGSHLVPQHHFFSSTIKRRLAMLQNLAEPSFAAFRRFMVIPIIAIVVLAFSCTIKKNAISVADPAKKKIVVLVDPAHGGTDFGAKSDMHSEKELSLKLASRLKELSSKWNIDIHLTRGDDQYITLAQRVELADKLHPDLFLSLHFNEEPGTDKAKGDFDIYVSSQSGFAAQSTDYSSGIFLAMQQGEILPTGGKCNHAPGEKCANCSNNTSGSDIPRIMSTNNDNIYLLKNAKVPCLVMILGNIKNDERMKQYTDNDKLDLLCNTILNGIANGANQQQNTNPYTSTISKNSDKLFSPAPDLNTTPHSCDGSNVVAVQLSIK